MKGQLSLWLMFFIVLAVCTALVDAEGQVVDFQTKESSERWIGYDANYRYVCTNFTASKTYTSSVVGINYNVYAVPNKKTTFELWDSIGSKPVNVLSQGSDLWTDDISDGWNNYSFASYELQSGTNYFLCIQSYVDFGANSLGWYYNDTSPYASLKSADGVTFLNYGTTEQTNFKLYNVSVIPSVPILDVFLTNTGGNLTAINETNNFYIKGNYYWDNGTVIDDAACSFNSFNTTAVFQKSGGNITLQNTGDILNMTLTESNTFIKDVARVDLCKGLTGDSANLLINGVSQINLSSVIPLCASGTHQQFINTSAFTGQSSINFTVRCETCTPSANSYIKIVSKNNRQLEYDRYANKYTENMIFSSPYYVYNTHKFAGFGKNVRINMTCDSDNAIENYPLTPVPLTVDIISINNQPYTPGMVVETNNSVIIFDAYNDIIQAVKINITFHNGTLIAQGTTESLSFNGNQTVGDGLYNISIYAIDDDNQVTLKKGYFNFTDTTEPSFLWVFPKKDNTTQLYAGSSNMLDITAYDINLFAVSCIIRNSSGTIINNFTAVNIPGSSYKINNNVSISPTGNYTAECTSWDSHTYVFIKPIASVVSGNKLTFEDVKVIDYEQHKYNVSIEYTGIYSVEEISTKKLTDRQIFNFSFYLGDTKFIKEVEHSYRLKCGTPFYLPKSEYTSHFVCWDAKQWFDLESPNILSYSVLKCPDELNCWDITTKETPSETAVYSSVGYLNEYTEIAQFEVIYPPAVPPADMLGLSYTCPTDTIQDTIMFIFLFVVIMVLLLMAKFWIKIPGVTMILAVITSSFFGLAIMGCSHLLGVIIMVFGLFFALIEFLS